MMCYLDKTSCSRYNTAVLGRGVCDGSGPKRILGERVGGGGGMAAGCEVTVPSNTWCHNMAASRIIINIDSAGDFPHPPPPSSRLPVSPTPSTPSPSPTLTNTPRAPRSPLSPWVRTRLVMLLCFAWSVVVILYPTEKYMERKSSYPHYMTMISFAGIEFSMTLKNISKFEHGFDQCIRH